MLQLRLHCAQKKQAPLSVVLSIFFVRIDKREGITFTPAVVAASLINNSCNRGLGGGKKISIRIIFQSFIGTKNADELINPIVIGFNIIITDRPIIT